jgi:hypothetical protein
MVFEIHHILETYSTNLKVSIKRGPTHTHTGHGGGNGNRRGLEQNVSIWWWWWWWWWLWLYSVQILASVLSREPLNSCITTACFINQQTQLQNGKKKVIVIELGFARTILFNTFCCM